MTTASDQNVQVELQEWMKYVSDDLSITQMTIPGTHDSYACKDKVPAVSREFAQTQLYSLTQQLELGVRYLDLRVGDPHLTMVHGKLCALYGTLPQALDEVWQFLQKHSTEAVLISIKWDDDKDDMAHDTSLRDTLWDTWERNHWYKDSTWPLLKDARGKAILLRRFDSEKNFPEIGINCSSFYSSSESSGDQGKWRQQDRPSESGLSMDERWNRSWDQLEKAKSAGFSDKCVYFTTLADQSIPIGPTAQEYARNMSPKLRVRFGHDDSKIDPKQNRFGVIIVDFIRYGDVVKIVSKNWLQDVCGYKDWKAGGPSIASWPSSRQATRIELQDDGNLVVYTREGPKWASESARAKSDNKLLSFQDDGNLVIKQGTNVIWATKRPFIKEDRLRLMHGPPFLMLDTSEQSGQVIWTPGGEIIDEPAFEVWSAAKVTKSTIANVLTHPQESIAIGATIATTWCLDKVNETFKDKGNPISDGIAKGAEFGSNGIKTVGNVVAEAWHTVFSVFG
jgi:hypothetical protein